MKELYCIMKGKKRALLTGIIAMVFLLVGFMMFDIGGSQVSAADVKVKSGSSGKTAAKTKVGKAANTAVAKGSSGKVFDPSDPTNPIYLGSYGEKRSTGNTALSGYASEAARLGNGWHPKGIDIKDLPKDKFGLINWVKLVNMGAINPQGVHPDDKKRIENKVLDMNILFKMKGGFVDNVLFPHNIHSYWLDCTNCHNSIFFQFAGWNKVKMQEIVKGEWCGRCHGRVAFPISDCTRCHRYPNGHAVEKDKKTTHRRPRPVRHKRKKRRKRKKKKA